MKKSSTKKNLIYNMIYQLTVMILPLITAPYLARVIGAHGVGVYSYYQSVSTYFLYFALLGISNYANRLVAKNSESEEKRNKIFSSIYYFQLCSTIFVSFIYLLYVLFGANDKIISSFFIISVCSVIFDVSWLFFGLQEFKTTSIRQIIVRIINFIAIMIFVKNEGDLNKYVIIMCVGNFISSFSLWLIAWRKVSLVKCKLQDIIVHIKPCLILFIPIIATSVYRIMDIIMVGKMRSMTEVGYYENAEKLIYISLGIITSFSAVMMPKISNYLGKNNKKQAKETFENSMEIAMWIGCALGFGIACISNEFVTFYFGDEFYPSIALSIGLSITIPIITWACIVRTLYLIPAEQDKIYVKSVIIGAVLNFITNIIAIPMLGTMGAVIGTVIAELSVAIYQATKTHRVLNLNKSLKCSLIFFFFGIIMTVFVRGIALIKINAIYKISAEIIGGAFVYLALSYIYFKKTNNKYLEEVIEKVKKWRK